MHETMIELKLEEEMKPLKEICEKLLSTIKHEFEKGVECVDTEEMGDAIDMLKDVYDAKEKIAKACYYKKIVEAMEKSEEEDKEEEKYMLRKFMEEANGNEEEARRYYDSWRHADGRFARKGTGEYYPRSRSRRGYTEMMPMYDMIPEIYRDNPEYGRDVDRERFGRMYYSSGGNSSNGNMGNMSGNRSNSGNDVSDGRRNYDGDGRNDGRRNENRSESRYDRARRGYSETKAMHNSKTPDDERENMRGLEELLSVVDGDIRELKPDMSPSEKAMVAQKFDMWSKMMKQQ